MGEKKGSNRTIGNRLTDRTILDITHTSKAISKKGEYSDNRNFLLNLKADQRYEKIQKYMALTNSVLIRVRCKDYGSCLADRGLSPSNNDCLSCYPISIKLFERVDFLRNF